MYVCEYVYEYGCGVWERVRGTRAGATARGAHCARGGARVRHAAMSRALRPGFLVSARPGHFTVIVTALLGYVFIAPFAIPGTLSSWALNVGVIVVLLTAVRRSWPGHPVQAVAALLGVATLLPTFGIGTTISTEAVAIHLASILLNLIVITAILNQVLTTEYVTLDTVVGAASVYLLIGLLWSALYALLEVWVPGSLRYPPDFEPTGPAPLVPLLRDTIVLYYSFETLTTIGYGDVTPASPPARFFSVCEALVGQLYLAVLVARFVGLQVTHHTTRRG